MYEEKHNHYKHSVKYIYVGRDTGIYTNSNRCGDKSVMIEYVK